MSQGQARAQKHGAGALHQEAVVPLGLAGQLRGVRRGELHFDPLRCHKLPHHVVAGHRFFPVSADNLYLLVRMVFQVQDPVTERHPGLCLRLERKSK